MEPGLVSFGYDPRDGELLGVHYPSGRPRKLVPVPPSPSNRLPSTLADTGLFSDLATLTPSPGLHPFAINAPFWSDRAIKQRWFALPAHSPPLDIRPDGSFAFPTGTVWVKHFELEGVVGHPQPARRLETRLLVKTDSGAYGVTYRWDADGIDAHLVPAAGLDEPFLTADQGATRQQTWRYPGWGECMRCHTDPAHHALGFHILDWDTDNLRSQEVALLDPVTHTPLARHRIEAFSHGTYLVFEVHGSVRIRIEGRPSETTVLSGVFLDDAPIPATTVHLAAPDRGTTLPAPALLTLRASVVPDGDAPTPVTFLANGQPLGTIPHPPYALVWSNVLAGIYHLEARAPDRLGRIAISPSTPLTVSFPEAQAVFLGYEPAARGTWEGRLGSLGHALAAGPVEWPDSIAFQPVAQPREHVWEERTRDRRATLPFPKLHPPVPAEDGLSVSWSGTPGALYRLLTRPDWATPWTPLPIVASSASGAFQAFDPFPDPGLPPARFLTLEELATPAH
ncbi:MAG: hypothetical protein KF833_08160 [Verrucomicrobiae bacterium]|nr:hypothetical protein [Verrucomicrobiae bacterium]